MVSEDRKLRLRGYEVYRFGGFELSETEVGKTILKGFFRALFDKHGIVSKQAAVELMSHI
jgi:hypothetical protein